MSLRKRIAVIDDDAYVLRVVEAALRGEGFEVAIFEDPRDALVGMRETAPDLILCDVLMPFMDGRALFREVKETPKLRDVPFVFLSGVDGDDEIVDTLERGADDFVSKPFNMTRLLAKVRATLRLAERRHDALSGPVGPAGALPLLEVLRGQPAVGPAVPTRRGTRPAGRTSWAASWSWPAGRRRCPARSPSTCCWPWSPGPTASSSGASTPRPCAAASRRPPEERAPRSAGPGFVPIPAGRLSMIRVRGQDIQVQTEGENRPEFTVTTVVARDGQVMRKVQSAWHHPFKRREDQEVARTQIDRQHDRVVAMLQGLTVEAAPVPVPTAPAAALGVDPSLLAWAISFVAEQVRDHLGAVMTLALLRGSLRRAARSRPALRSFRVAEDGRVVPATARGARCRAAAVEAVAAWTADFLSSAGEIVDRAGGIRLRQATRMMEAELERIGFYAAFDAVVAAGRRPRPSARSPTGAARASGRFPSSIASATEARAAPARPQQPPQDDALEGGLAVDAVVVGAAEHDVRHLGDAAAGLVLLGRGQVLGEDAGARQPAVAGLEHGLGLLPVPGLEAGRQALLLRHHGARERGQAVSAEQRHPHRAGRLGRRAPGPRGRRARGGGPPPGTAGATWCPRPSRSGGAPRPARRGPSRSAPRSRCRAGPRPAAPGGGRGARRRPRAAAARRPTACAR